MQARRGSRREQMALKIEGILEPEVARAGCTCASRLGRWGQAGWDVLAARAEMAELVGCTWESQLECSAQIEREAQAARVEMAARTECTWESLLGQSVEAERGRPVAPAVQLAVRKAEREN